MNENQKRMRWIAWLWLIALAPYAVCAANHTCMAGHMQHPPFPLWQWANDMLWVFCMSAVFVLSWRTRVKRVRWLRYGSLACIVFRIPLGDLGGTAFLLEMPLCLWLAVIAVCYLVRADKMESEPAGPPCSEPAARSSQG